MGIGDEGSRDKAFSCEFSAAAVLLLKQRQSLLFQGCWTSEKPLNRWEEKFRGHPLHTLELWGSPSAFYHFSRVLERPLPRAQRMKIQAFGLIPSCSPPEISPNAASLGLLEEIPLQVLDLRNVVLSWPSYSHLLKGLRELHPDFKDPASIVKIPADVLFGASDAPQQLQHLSLVKVGHEISVPPDLKRTLRFSNLISLSPENEPMVVKYTLISPSSIPSRLPPPSPVVWFKSLATSSPLTTAFWRNSSQILRRFRSNRSKRS